MELDARLVRSPTPNGCRQADRGVITSVPSAANSDDGNAGSKPNSLNRDSISSAARRMPSDPGARPS
ncbi:MAG: hypothetical protein D6692_04300 [Planctomycetota bacterium]|nr:MAG: hypothetical protein D6692_04300 [Planctomycetota bacterium]